MEAVFGQEIRVKVAGLMAGVAAEEREMHPVEQEQEVRVIMEPQVQVQEGVVVEQDRRVHVLMEEMGNPTLFQETP